MTSALTPVVPTPYPKPRVVLAASCDEPSLMNLHSQDFWRAVEVVAELAAVHDLPPATYVHRWGRKDVLRLSYLPGDYDAVSRWAAALGAPVQTSFGSKVTETVFHGLHLHVSAALEGEASGV